MKIQLQMKQRAAKLDQAALHCGTIVDDETISVDVPRRNSAAEATRVSICTTNIRRNNFQYYMQKLIKHMSVM